MSKDCASGSSPCRGTRPCVVRSPQSPWYDAGTRTDPAVSVARPISAWPVATADAGPLEDPPGQRARQRAVRRGAVVHVVAGDAVRELVGAGDAAQRRAAAQQVGHRGRGRGLGARLVEECRVARADAVALDREQILDGDREPGERAFPRPLPERIADRAPHRPVERLRARGDVRGGDEPAAVDALPELGLQPGAAAGEARDRHEQRDIRRRARGARSARSRGAALRRARRGTR